MSRVEFGCFETKFDYDIGADETHRFVTIELGIHDTEM